MPRSRRAAVVLLAIFFGGASRLRAESFAREDWVYSVEPTHLDYWGVNHWGVMDFMLPYRAVQRGKHQLESSYAHNWRFGSETGGVAGFSLRALSTVLDFGLFIGPQNLSHVMAHDARARELYRDYPGSYQFVSKRFSQVLPAYFGGKELGSNNERRTGSPVGADVQTLENSTLWEMDNQFAYFAGKDVLAADEANATQVENFLFYRIRMQEEYLEQYSGKRLDQNCVNGSSAPECQQQSSPFVSDYTNYLKDLNHGRYGVSQISDFRLKMGDLAMAHGIQFADPVFLVALYRYGTDYLVHGNNRSGIPMIPLGSTGLSYLPGLRVDLSPFGIEYIQDNYLRWRRVLANLFWTRGDDRYQRRLGAGFDLDNLPLVGSVTAGVFGELYKQPFVNRILDPSPLSPSEFGSLHNVYNYGASLRAPLAAFGEKQDPRQLLLYLKAGRKSEGWIPGEYIKGAAYVQVGLGLHL